MDEKLLHVLFASLLCSSILDCHHYQSVISIQDSLLSQYRLNTSKFNVVTTAENASSLPVIYMITPTYARPTQKADLIRLCFTLMHVPMLHWIIVEDSVVRTKLVERLLSREHSCKIARSSHLHFRTSENLRLGKKEAFWHKCRGAEQRNHGIDWLFESAAEGVLDKLHGAAKVEGVVYFGDDDNTYDIEVFKEVRINARERGVLGGLGCAVTLLY